MRTKTLLLTAALSAAGVATSMAQVYSVNAVGYVNTQLVPGLNLISNPLEAADNKIKTLLTGVPVNTQVYRFVNVRSRAQLCSPSAGILLPSAMLKLILVKVSSSACQRLRLL
jgi:hypothetical protein